MSRENPKHNKLHKMSHCADWKFNPWLRFEPLLALSRSAYKEADILTITSHISMLCIVLLSSNPVQHHWGTSFMTVSWHNWQKTQPIRLKYLFSYVCICVMLHVRGFVCISANVMFMCTYLNACTCVPIQTCMWAHPFYPSLGRNIF